MHSRLITNLDVPLSLPLKVEGLRIGLGVERFVTAPAQPSGLAITGRQGGAMQLRHQKIGICMRRKYTNSVGAIGRANEVIEEGAEFGRYGRIADIE